ncbi:serine hydrolase domain-containing protein [Acinetobacter rudis]|uniref:Serine hydrolase domain-containing protein n=1 Tax=Acinetobacter rudis TaxID=632955 RepID=A0AAW8JC86_9GAMM|nr:serine hydrolase domain-containing protein [Acinetobacter rudis]MDQ8936705.1 serine hydrolase domain-containing protein [Acinetobacter rudis]MDQ8954064.1 serine hydrolase domain-containing protein [Acinetobacter rudis]MDQ9018926.1 serine hydrolase domain-containing protein [Acinetobacter rudis]
MNGLTELIFADTQHFQGTVAPHFNDLAKQFSRLLQPGVEQGGAALAVYFRGEKVVDIYTGKKTDTEQWAEDSLSICYSTGKGVLATLAHILVSQGLLSYDHPIAHYWPEFAQHNKAEITLAHVLCHQSGLFDIRNIIEKASDMADWSAMLQSIEQATPRFKAGTDTAYQALTFGWLLGGVLEKATGQSLATLMHKYLVEPLELDGAYFGVPQSELHRVAKPCRKVANTNTTAKAKSPRKTTFSERLLELSGHDPQDFLDAMVPRAMRDFSFFSEQGLTAVMPAVNGAFTARSLAKVYAMLAQQGQWQGQQLIDHLVFHELSQIQTYKRDRVMPIPMKWRLGYHRVITLGKRVKSGFGHVGYNGSGAWCDPQRNLSFAYVHNFPVASMTGDYRLWGLTQEALRCADAVITGHKGWF